MPDLPPCLPPRLAPLPHTLRAHKQGIFGTANMPGIGWVPQLGALAFYLPWSEYTKRAVRSNPDGWWARNMAW